MAASVHELNHEQRRLLNDEVHARPSDSIATPSTIVSVVSLSGPDSDDEGRLHRLLNEMGVTELPSIDAKHLLMTIGDCRLRWEKHTEFARYSFVFPGEEDGPFSRSAGPLLPEKWLEELRGELMMAVHMSIVPMPDEGLDVDAVSKKFLDGNTLVGSMIARGRGAALTDFRMRDDGFNRILVLNEAMPQQQTGRYVQRLMEFEAYRMMALLALPVARGLFPKLNATETELAAINESLIGSGSKDESALLERLTILAAENEGRHATTDFRLSAAVAYYDILVQRNRDMREDRITGTQMFAEFVSRRLTPAINTCRTVGVRQQALVSRMARATQLLSTRIDVAQQSMNSQILGSLNRRMESQLRLQATVEGISVAAVTYYVVMLVGMLADDIAEQGVPLNTSVLRLVAIPAVALTIFYLVRRIRHRISTEEPE